MDKRTYLEYLKSLLESSKGGWGGSPLDRAAARLRDFINNPTQKFGRRDAPSPNKPNPPSTFGRSQNPNSRPKKRKRPGPQS